MVMWGRSVWPSPHDHSCCLGRVSSPHQTFFLGVLSVLCAHTFACNWQQPFLDESAEGRRLTVEIISWSISTKVWNQAGIKLGAPESSVRHITDCATRPGMGKKLMTLLRSNILLNWLYDLVDSIKHACVFLYKHVSRLLWVLEPNYSIQEEHEQTK